MSNTTITTNTTNTTNKAIAFFKTIINKVIAFSKLRPVKIIFALIVIAVIMTVVAFGVIALVNALSPKCKNDEIEKDGKCFNKECNDECDVVGQYRNYDTPPLCPCKCDDDQSIAEDPNNDNKKTCVKSCGDGNFCNNPFDEFSCLFNGYNSKLMCSETLTTGYKICSSSEFEQVDGHYVVCPPNTTCATDEKKGTFCEVKITGSCNEGEVNGCDLTAPVDQCASVAEGAICTSYSEEDWRSSVFGYCSTPDNKQQSSLDNGSCAPKDKLSIDSSSGLLNFINCLDKKACKVGESGCGAGCCVNVCRQKGNCGPIDQVFTKDCGQPCMSTHLAHCEDYSKKKNCETCCTHTSENNGCGQLCSYVSKFGPGDKACTKDKDCRGLLNVEFGNDNPDQSGNIREVCDTSVGDGGKCKLVCGDEQKGDFSCVNNKTVSPYVSSCFKKDLCYYDWTNMINAPGFGGRVPVGDDMTSNKLICTDNHDLKEPDSNDDNTMLRWRPYEKGQYGNYVSKMIIPISIREPSADESICYDKAYAKSQQQQDIATQFLAEGAVQDLDFTNDNATATVNCNIFSDFISSDNKCYPSTGTENFSNYNLNDTRNSIPWINGTFPSKSCQAGQWDNLGNYKNGGLSCVDGDQIRQRNCKFLQSGDFCQFGSLDGINCLGSHQTSIQSDKVCPPASIAKKTYDNNKACKMPYVKKSSAEYLCLGNQPNGFGTCCNNGIIELEKCEGAESFFCSKCSCPGLSQNCPDLSNSEHGYPFFNLFMLLNAPEYYTNWCWLKGGTCKHACDIGCNCDPPEVINVETLFPYAPWSYPDDSAGNEQFQMKTCAINSVIILRLSDDSDPNPIYLNLKNPDKEFDDGRLELGLEYNGNNPLKFFYRVARNEDWATQGKSSVLGNVYNALSTIAFDKFHTKKNVFSKIYININDKEGDDEIIHAYSNPWNIDGDSGGQEYCALTLIKVRDKWAVCGAHIDYFQEWNTPPCFPYKNMRFHDGLFYAVITETDGKKDIYFSRKKKWNWGKEDEPKDIALFDLKFTLSHSHGYDGTIDCNSKWKSLETNFRTGDLFKDDKNIAINAFRIPPQLPIPPNILFFDQIFNNNEDDEAPPITINNIIEKMTLADVMRIS